MISGYVVVVRGRKTFQNPTVWKVFRVVGQGRLLQKFSTHKEAWTYAEENAEGLPVRNWNECVVCGGAWPESFMIRNSVWAEAGLRRGVVHIHCLEERLGRPLAVDDFDLAIPINEVLSFGIALGKEASREEK